MEEKNGYNPTLNYFAGGASLLLLIGTFLPWITFGFVSRKGIDNPDGVIVLILALAGLGLAFLNIQKKRNLGWPFTVLGALGIIVGFLDLWDVAERGKAVSESFDQLFGMFGGDASGMFSVFDFIGGGLYLVIIASVLLIIFGIALRSKARRLHQESGVEDKRKLFLGIALILLLAIFVPLFTGRKSSAPTDDQQTKQEEPQKVFKIGEKANLDGKTLIVNKVVRSWIETDRYPLKPDDGKEFILVHVEVTNEGEDTAHFSEYDFDVEDSNGALHSPTYAGTVPEDFDSTKLVPGGKTAGNIAFEVPKDDSNLKLHFAPNFFGKKSIIVDLSNGEQHTGGSEGAVFGTGTFREAPTSVTHSVCKDGACVKVEGAGTDECYWSNDCIHKECQGASCVEVNGKGDDQCYIDSSCVHNECRDRKCIEVEGSGDDDCYGDYSCQPTTRRVCKDGECVEEEGDGDDECSIGADCCHSECRDGECVDVPGKGDDLCVWKYDCVHSECKDGQCVEVAGAGEDSCYVDSDCMHSECRSGECVEVAGAGDDACYWDGDCVHNECVGGKCVEVEGGGKDECYTDWGCEN